MSPARDRRRDDRRSDHVSLAEYTVPELRKALLTVFLLTVVLGLFFYMVRSVVVAVIAGIVAGTYTIPIEERIRRVLRSRPASAICTMVLLAVPLVAMLAYSWIEISDAATYLNENSAEVVAGLQVGLDRLPFGAPVELSDQIAGWVQWAANSSAAIADELREAVDVLLVGIAVFFFTTFYVLTDHERILKYLADPVPGRYRNLVDPVTRNIRGVVYGVLYGTFLTQALKSTIILALNLVFQVPLAIVLGIASFFIGLLPIIGSWTVYTPVALYLMLWRGDFLSGAAVLVIGFVGNTLLISTYLRPKIAAEKSHVLNFYWMFIALVTGVYTFGLAGIIIGPVLIAVLKAILDAVTARPTPVPVPVLPSASAEARAQ